MIRRLPCLYEVTVLHRKHLTESVKTLKSDEENEQEKEKL